MTPVISAAALLVPIIALLFPVLVLGVIFLYAYKVKRARMNKELREKLLERGQLTPEMERLMDVGSTAAAEERSVHRLQALRTGLVLGGLGVAVLLGLAGSLVLPEPQSAVYLTVGLMFLFAGAALLIFYRLAGRPDGV